MSERTLHIPESILGSVSSQAQLTATIRVNRPGIPSVADILIGGRAAQIGSECICMRRILDKEVSPSLSAPPSMIDSAIKSQMLQLHTRSPAFNLSGARRSLFRVNVGVDLLDPHSTVNQQQLDTKPSPRDIRYRFQLLTESLTSHALPARHREEFDMAWLDGIVSETLVIWVAGTQWAAVRGLREFQELSFEYLKSTALLWCDMSPDSLPPDLRQRQMVMYLVGFCKCIASVSPVECLQPLASIAALQIDHVYCSNPQLTITTRLQVLDDGIPVPTHVRPDSYKVTYIGVSNAISLPTIFTAAHAGTNQLCTLELAQRMYYILIALGAAIPKLRVDDTPSAPPIPASRLQL